MGHFELEIEPSIPSGAKYIFARRSSIFSAIEPKFLFQLVSIYRPTNSPPKKGTPGLRTDFHFKIWSLDFTFAFLVVFEVFQLTV